jgi:sugar-specific transcriptional regulator TrmB
VGKQVSSKERIQLLVQLAFTSTQAKVYLTLLQLTETDARTISEKALIPRPEVYRTLNELQKKGLVEKLITKPYRFRATSIELGLQVLMIEKTKQYKEIMEKSKEFLRKYQENPIAKTHEHEPKIMIIEGKNKLLQKIKAQHANVQQSVEILTTLDRWMQILDTCFEDYVKALARKVKYRIVVEKPASKIEFAEAVRVLVEKPGFELRISSTSLETNAAIFDRKEATFNFYPSKSLTESPIIWTNHPSFISMGSDHFEKIWKSAKKY